MLIFKNIYRLCFLIALLIPSAVFAASSEPVLFNIVIHNNLYKQSNAVNYRITLPANTFIKDELVEGRIKSGEYKVIEIYANNTSAGKVHLSIIDAHLAARVIWQGALNYDKEDNYVYEMPEMVNKKEYDLRTTGTGGMYNRAEVNFYIGDR